MAEQAAGSTTARPSRPQDGWRVLGHPAGRRSVRRRHSTAGRRRDRLVGLGSCRPALQRWRWQDSRTDHIWRERYGHGLPDARPDCVRAVSHTLGSRFTGSGSVNYFRYRGRSADSIADPFSTYAILAGTPNAPYPNGTRLVRLLDAAEFNTLAAAGALPAPGQFLASAQTSDFLSDPLTEVTLFRRPAVRYQGDYNWSASQRLSVGYEWERETNPDVTGFDLDNNAVFADQSTFANRWFLTVGARIDSKEEYDA
jgi:hypothetical protein